MATLYSLDPVSGFSPELRENIENGCGRYTMNNAYTPGTAFYGNIYWNHIIDFLTSCIILGLTTYKHEATERRIK